MCIRFLLFCQIKHYYYYYYCMKRIFNRPIIKKNERSLKNVAMSNIYRSISGREMYDRLHLFPKK